jgi:hypothetical protein
MPRYRVFYLRDDLSLRFRELPPASPRKELKARDYELAGEMEAAGPYAVWQALQSPGSEACPLAVRRPFAVGDAVEQVEGQLQLCVFGGFEDAAWWTTGIESLNH